VPGTGLEHTPKQSAVYRFVLASNRHNKQDDETRNQAACFQVTTWLRLRGSAGSQRRRTGACGWWGG
jgi:single-stranded DNA-binding protein